MPNAGYSQTHLTKKMGIKEGYTIQLISEPDYYYQLFTDFPANVDISGRMNKNIDSIHFTTQVSDYRKQLL